MEEEELDRRSARLVAELRARPFPPWHLACDPEEASSLSALALSARPSPRPLRIPAALPSLPGACPPPRLCGTAGAVGQEGGRTLRAA